MIVEHRLTDIDSIQSLALRYLKDATRWGEIVDYNRLRYPYILRDKESLKSFFGSGYITITRINYQTAVTIKKGWTFKTKSGLMTGSTVRVFEVVEDTIVPAGVPQANIPMRCTVPGNFGNVMSYMITEVGDNTAQFSGIQFLEIYNEFKFSGGRTLDVKVTGDIIYIPTEYVGVAPEDVEKTLELIGGEDLLLDDLGNLVIEEGGDLASVHGSDNINHAVTARLKTELGDLIQHPGYGTPYQELIGKPNLANRTKLMEIAVYRSLAQESRITDISIDHLAIDGTSVRLSISYKPAVGGTPGNLSLVI